MTKHILYFLPLALLGLFPAQTVVAQSTTPKVFLKYFNLEGVTQVTLDLPGTIEVKEYEGTSLRFQIDISVPAGTNAALIDQLANVGRYNLSAKTASANHMIIDAPNLSRQIKVKGNEVKELLHFTVSAPKGVVVEQLVETPPVVVREK